VKITVVLTAHTGDGRGHLENVMLEWQTRFGKAAAAGVKAAGYGVARFARRLVTR
jgi:hypothetical protein